MNSCTILACQISVPVTDTVVQRDAHVNRAVKDISTALSSRSAQLVVLPELASVDYSRSSFDRLTELAESLEGRTVESMSKLASEAQTTIVFGMPRVEQNHYFISQIVVDDTGTVIACYDKLHICQYGASMEKEYFSRGNKVTIFEVAGFRFAPIICYDIRIPELSRELAIKHEVDCILHCGAYYRDESFSTWHAFVTTRAMENQLYMLSLNRAGSQYGASIFCPPWTDEQNPAEYFADCQEELRFVQVENTVIESVRENYTFLKDRLKDYSALV